MKLFVKLTFAVMCVASVCLGGYKSYIAATQSTTDGLFIEDVEAMSKLENHDGFTKICKLSANPEWCQSHSQFKWTYTKSVTVCGDCQCTAEKHDCCK